MINMPNKTLQREINDYIKNIKKTKKSNKNANKKSTIKWTASAMSKARLKVSPEIFIELNKELIVDIYEDKEEIKLYKDFRILGTDGTRLQLPNMNIAKDKMQSEHIKEIYGQSSDHNGKYGVMPRASIIYDLENNFIIDGILGSLYTSEAFMAIEHINRLIEYKQNIKTQYNDLLIYDRGYPSMGLICYHYKHKLDFLMRVNSKSFKALNLFRQSNKTDEVIEVEVTRSILANLSQDKQHPCLKQIQQELKVKDKVKVRAIKVLLDDGEIEILLTSLLSQEKYPNDIFKELYFKRWKVEISYDILKNIFKVENFSGLTQIAINQDFFACILTSNICSLIMSVVMEEKVSLYNKDKEKKKRKYFYQLNKKFSIGCMKNNLVLMLIENTSINKIYQTIEDEIMDSLLPIKPDRKFSRNIKYNAKFPVSKKDGY